MTYQVKVEFKDGTTKSFQTMKAACRWVNSQNKGHPFTKHRYCKLTNKIKERAKTKKRYFGGIWSYEEIIVKLNNQKEIIPNEKWGTPKNAKKE